MNNTRQMMLQATMKLISFFVITSFVIGAAFVIHAAIAADPAQNDKVALSDAEVRQETPGLVDAALAGPLKDVSELVYSAGYGFDYCWWGWSFDKLFDLGWGFDPDKCKDSFRRRCYAHMGTGADGCALYRIDPRTGKRSTILQNPKGGIFGVCVDYDGKRIVFAYQQTAEDYPHLWEVHPDGSGLRQLTDGKFFDVDPCMLPDGDIIFSSTRCKRQIACCNSQANSLFLCRSDGTDIRLYNGHIETQFSPSVLPDGRVAFAQWEYTATNGIVFSNLAFANPDGSGYGALAGPVFGTTQSFWYSTLRYPRQVPGTHEISALFYPDESSNNDLGWIVRYDMDRGPTDLNALRIISPHKRPLYWGQQQRGPLQSELAWGHPFPLSDNCTLVTTQGAVQVMDAAGRHQTLFTDTSCGGHLGWVQPLAPRPREPVIPSGIDPHRDTGAFVLANANLSRTDMPYDASKLLVLEELPRPVPAYFQTACQGGTLFIDRVIGTVPIEQDGSGYFTAPADRELFFVLLDARGRAIKKMRSWTALKPGETRSCIGCHEQRTMAPPALGDATLLALRRAPSQPECRGPDVIDFPRHIQPILDRYCVKCHDNQPVPGRPMLSGDLSLYFNLAYEQLRDAKQVETHLGAGADVPGTSGSAVSPLLDKLAGGHHGVKARPEEIELVRNWIDAGANYSGTYASTYHWEMWNYVAPGGNRWGEPFKQYMRQPKASPCDIDVLMRRCDACHDPGGVKGTLTGANGGPPPPIVGQTQIYAWPWAHDWPNPERVERYYDFNLTHPERSLLLLAPLARSAGGLGLCGGKPGDWRPTAGLRNGTPLKPGETRKNDGIFADKNDPDYVKLLVSLQQAHRYLFEDVTRQDTPDFRPPFGWVWMMQEWGYLDKNFDPMKDRIDVYAVERRYWDSFHPKLETAK